MAGRDLREGGTWLGVNAMGRCATVTNFRDPTESVPNARSRGEIVTAALRHPGSVESYLASLDRDASAYRGFNFVFADAESAWVYESRSRRITALSAGIHVVSNGALSDPWPKAASLARAAALAIAGDGDCLVERLMAALSDTTIWPDDTLPKTGVPLEVERALSAIYVDLPHYGTRTQSVVLGNSAVCTLSARERGAASIVKTNARIALPT